jgi:hypothetical protein
VVAAAGHRTALRLADRDAAIVFVRRNVAALDAERRATELGQGWTTTVEQTVLDLAARPGLGGMAEESIAAVRTLLPRADHAVLAELAAAQRRRVTLHRILSDR